MAEFPNTTWGLIVRLSDPEASRRGLETLCQRYWRPICSYLRCASRLPEADAADLTQAFFLWLLEHEVFSRFEPGQGRFRHYLKGVLRNFVRNERTALARLKRGGGVQHVPLVDGHQDLGNVLPDDRELTPEQAFDQAWVLTLVESATEQVLGELRAGGRSRAEGVYRAYHLAPAGEQPTYASVAEQLGVPLAAVRRDLFLVREAIRGAIRRELRETVTGDEELEQEWSALLG